jgi:SWI/SNF-related matrix-associated actin-dependent regulator 1 of chromatin subfamily A
MVVTKKNKIEASKILSEYNGKNSHINYLKNKNNINDYDIEYILKNYQKEQPILIDKIVKISDYYGKELQRRYDLSFYPDKIYIYTLAGETDYIYHCWVKYSKTQEKYVSLFIPKKALLDTLIEIDWESYPIDVDKLNLMLKTYNRKLKLHQEDGIRFLLANKKCILADEAGLGKSTELIGASILSNCNKILITCPTSLKTNWAQELEYFGINDYAIISGGDKTKWDLTKKYTICNYDIWDKKLHTVAYDDVWDDDLQKYIKRKSRNKEKIAKINERNELLKAKFDMFIIDEAHSLSNSTSAKYKAIKDFIKQSKIEYIYEASGTPIKNNSKNYYNLLTLIDSDVSRDWNYYMVRYCGAKKIRLKTGNEILIPQQDTNTEELYEKTKSIYLRRDKADLDLPNREIIEKFYNLSHIDKIEYDKLWAEYEKEQENLGKNKEDLNKDLVEGGLYRQYLAEKMVPYTIKLSDNHIKNNEKVIIFTCYDKEVELLKEYYQDKCVVYNGKMSSKQKDNAFLNFKTDDNIMVIIGQIISMGVGLTLNNSHITIFNSFTWVPSDIQQAMDRNYRLGQTNDVTTYIQLFKDTHNEYVYNKVLKKELMINTVIKNEKNK